jgi:hypothetical protein
MTGEEKPAVRCVNEGCPRPAEPQERYCAACGLERALFRRDRRFEPARRPGSGGQADRR